MKKILYAVIVAALSFGISNVAEAQVPYTTTVKNASISAADTITMTSVEGNIVMFEYNYTETSGTTAGKIYLEGKFLNSWVKLDSVSLSDVTTIQTLRTIITQTSYKSYRFVNTNTSNATGTVHAGYLRRPQGRAPAPAPMPVAKANMPIDQYADVLINNNKLSYWIKYNRKGREAMMRRSFVI